MNNNIDLTKILKDCPKGWKLYTPIFGEVEFSSIEKDCSISINYVSKIKPYLFPLSSMTEEQKSQYNFYLTRIVFTYDASLLIDWLNKNHFEYRGLIEKELAIDATGLNVY